MINPYAPPLQPIEPTMGVLESVWDAESESFHFRVFLRKEDVAALHVEPGWLWRGVGLIVAGAVIMATSAVIGVVGFPAARMAISPGVILAIVGFSMVVRAKGYTGNEKPWMLGEMTGTWGKAGLVLDGETNWRFWPIEQIQMVRLDSRAFRLSINHWLPAEYSEQVYLPAEVIPPEHRADFDRIAQHVTRGGLPAADPKWFERLEAVRPESKGTKFDDWLRIGDYRHDRSWIIFVPLVASVIGLVVANPQWGWTMTGPNPWSRWLIIWGLVTVAVVVILRLLAEPKLLGWIPLERIRGFVNRRRELVLLRGRKWTSRDCTKVRIDRGGVRLIDRNLRFRLPMRCIDPPLLEHWRDEA